MRAGVACRSPRFCHSLPPAAPASCNRLPLYHRCDPVRRVSCRARSIPPSRFTHHRRGQTANIHFNRPSFAMDKMSKFRRKPKPKPPAIETAVDPRRSTDTTDSVRSENNSSTNGSSSPTARAAAKTTKKSPFRSLRLRTSGKRARGSPPAELPPSSPPGPALVGQDGHISQGSRKSGEYHKSGRPGVDPDAPKIPGFLSLSEQGEC